MKKSLLLSFALALPLAASAQVQLISGYNFGQFLGGGAPSLDGTTGDTVGSVGANWAGTNAPPLESGGGYVGSNALTGDYSNGTGRAYWDGSNGSTAFSLNGTGIVAVDVGANAINGRNVYNTQMFLVGDDLNLALSTGGAGSLAFVTNTIGFTDYNPDSFAPVGLGNDANFTFAASTPGANVTINWLIDGATFASTVISGSTFSAYSVDLPLSFYGDASATLVAQFGGSVMLDNVQFNGVTASAIPEPSTYAMMAGGLALGIAVFRRRQAAAAAAAQA